LPTSTDLFTGSFTTYPSASGGDTITSSSWNKLQSLARFFAAEHCYFGGTLKTGDYRRGSFEAPQYAAQSLALYTFRVTGIVSSPIASGGFQVQTPLPSAFLVGAFGVSNLFLSSDIMTWVQFSQKGAPKIYTDAELGQGGSRFLQADSSLRQVRFSYGASPYHMLTDPWNLYCWAKSTTFYDGSDLQIFPSGVYYWDICFAKWVSD
jgi:hypothetical protein